MSAGTHTAVDVARLTHHCLVCGASADSCSPCDVIVRSRRHSCGRGRSTALKGRAQPRRACPPPSNGRAPSIARASAPQDRSGRCRSRMPGRRTVKGGVVRRGVGRRDLTRGAVSVGGHGTRGQARHLDIVARVERVHHRLEAERRRELVPVRGAVCFLVRGGEERRNAAAAEAFVERLYTDQLRRDRRPARRRRHQQQVLPLGHLRRQPTRALYLRGPCARLREVDQARGSGAARLRLEAPRWRAVEPHDGIEPIDGRALWLR